MVSTRSWYCLRVFSEGSCLNILSKKARVCTAGRLACLPGRRAGEARQDLLGLMMDGVTAWRMDMEARLETTQVRAGANAR
jgi:hypothetical protein